MNHTINTNTTSLLDDLTSTLLSAQNPDSQIRKQAENTLQNIENKGFPQYLYALCSELSNASKPVQSRQLAGILLKNAVDAKSEERKKSLQMRWLSVNKEIRLKIREIVLQILNSNEKSARDVACLVISKIMAIEIVSESEQMKSFIPNLIENIKNTNSIQLKESTFKIIGFLAEDIPDLMEKYRHLILEGINGALLNKEPAQKTVQFEATMALYRVLFFVEESMKNKDHRKIIIQMIFTAATSSELETKIIAFECLSQIAELYYIYLEDHMSDIFHLTHNTLSADCAPDSSFSNLVATEPNTLKIRAIEFWSTLAEVETDIIHQIEEDKAFGRESSSRNLFCFVSKALKHLIPVIWKCMTQQNYAADDDIDDTMDTQATAAATCLHLVALCTRDEVLKEVLPLIEQHISSSNWREREASVLAFGSILDGPSKDKLKAIVTQAMPTLLNYASNDQNLHVRDSASWTLGRVCDLVPQSIEDRILEPLMKTLINGLKEGVPLSISEHMCWAIHNLAEAIPSGQNNPLSKYFEALVSQILLSSLRKDAQNNRFITSCYETIHVLITSSSNDSIPQVEHFLKGFMEKLNHSFNQTCVSSRETSFLNLLQAMLCGVMSASVSRLPRTPTLKSLSNNLMQLFIRVLNAKDKIIYEESLMAIGSLVNQIESDFEPYFPPLKPFLITGLSGDLGPSVCEVSVGLLGDISRALGKRISPFCDEIFALMLQLLQKPDFDRNVKPHIITCIGDIALSIGGEYFERYFTYVMTMLCQASQICLQLPNQGNFDLIQVEYMNQLRESILEAITMILQCLKDGKKETLFVNYVPLAISVIDSVVKDENRDFGLISASLGCFGDLIDCLGSSIKDLLLNSSVEQLISIARTCQDEKVGNSLNWALIGINKLKNY